MPNATYTVKVDWNRDGDYTDTYDDLSSYVIRIKAFNGFREPFLNVAGVSTLEIELDNSSRRFSPEYSGGPLYGANWKNRPIQLQAVYSGTTTLWTGYTTDIQPQPGSNAQKRAILRAEGLRRVFDTSKIYLPIQENKRTDETIELILNQLLIAPATADGPWALGLTNFGELGDNTYIAGTGLSYSLEQGKLTPSYVGDNWDDGITAYEAINQLVRGERGKFFFDRSGQAIFWNRHHLLTDYASDLSVTDSQYISINYVYGSDRDIVNVVIVTYHPRKAATGTSILWELDTPVDIPATTEKRIKAKFTEQTSGSVISGLDIEKPGINPSTLVFTSGTADLVSWEPSSRGADMVFVAREMDAELSTLQIYGRKLTAFNQTEVEARDAESEFNYGRSELNISLPVIDMEADARSVADYEVGRRARPYGRVNSITLLNKTAAILTNQITYTIGTRITVSETQTGHSADYFIIGEEHTISEAFKRHETIWFLEPAGASQFWLLGTTNFSELGETTTVAPA